MSNLAHRVWMFLPALLSLLFVGWLLWRWLKSSTEPGALIVRWLISLVVLGFTLRFAVRARDEFGKIAAVLIAAVAGIAMTLVWRQQFCDWVGDLFAGIYTGGSQEVDPAPFYS